VGSFGGLCAVCGVAAALETLGQGWLEKGKIFLKQSFTLMILSSFVLSASLAGARAQGASQAVLTVEVVNETPSGTPVTGDPVFVHIYDHGQVLRTLEGRVGADGKAVFENVPTGDKIAAVPRSKHNNMMFSGNTVALVAAKDAFSARISVFDVSTDKSSLSIRMHHLMIESTVDTLVFTEFMQLANSSNMAVTSKEEEGKDQGVVLEIKLPKGFKDLEAVSYFEEHALVVTDEGFYDTMAVPPGEHQVSFTYTLDITSKTMDIVKGITLPTSKLVVFAELGQAELLGLGEAKNRATSTAGTEIKYYTRDKVAAGEEITFQLAGLTVRNSGPSAWVILAVVFGVVMVVVVLRLRPGKT